MSPRWMTRLFVILVVCTGLFVLVSYYRGAVTGDSGGRSAGPRLREVDVETVIRRIQEGRLSDKEALYYRRLP